MAFQQPTLQRVQRSTLAPAQDQATEVTDPPTLVIGEPQEWILFPQTKPHARTQATPTGYTPRTIGFSDFGSLNSVTKSKGDHAIYCEATLGSEDEEELDSLVDGLHAFHESPLPYNIGNGDHSESVFPRHDGLGTFQATLSAAQNQIWHLERRNPRKYSYESHQRRQSNVKRKLDEIEEHDSTIIEDEKRVWIEKWRLEHSRILLDEIEKETRRRIQSLAKSQAAGQERELGSTNQLARSIREHTEPTRSLKQPEGSAKLYDESETFLQRIMRRVIHNFIGLDDKTLSIILGEALPEEGSIAPGLSSAPSTSASPALPNDSRTWQARLLSTLGHKLGIVLDQLSVRPSTEISTLLNPSNSDYAGIPVTQPTSSRTHPRGHSDSSSLPSPSFDFTAPTASALVADSQHASLWGIEEPHSIHQPSQLDPAYWEQRPNLRTVFGVFRTHFTASSGIATPKPPAQPNHLATTSMPETLRRAALIRQYHPLVKTESHRQRSQRGWHARYARYVGSSCGSQSLRPSRRGTMTTTSCTSYGNGSSRNFWDIGGNLTGSGIEAGTLGMGSWGEV